LHGLVNNAGVAIAGPMEFLPIDELRRSLEINVVGVAMVTQHFLPLLRQGRGRIVNISSTAGFLAVPMIGAYSASKFALEAMSDSLRQER
jgi:short-subunit dehydrogenase